MKKTLAPVVLFALLSSTALAQPVVAVRSGIHERYNRLVFDWTSPVRYTMKQENGHISILFDTKSTANFKQALATQPPFIRNLQQHETANGLEVTFQIPIDSRVQAFADGTKSAFDVLRMKKAPPVFDDKEVSNKETTSGPQKPEVLPEDKSTAVVQQPQPAAGKTAEQPPAQTEEKVVPGAPPAKPADDQHPQTLADVLAKPPSEQGLKDPAAAAKPSADAIKEDVAPDKGTTITLLPDKLTRLAAFERGGRFWMVIDQAQKDITPQVKGEWAEQMKTATRIDLKDATAFVFDLPSSLKDSTLSILRDGPKWKIWINPSDKPYIPTELTMNVSENDDGSNPRLTLYAGEQPKVITIKDSAMGDKIWIVPVRSPDGRVSQAHKTPAYQILPTYMGAVIAPTSDNLTISTLNDLVLLSPTTGQKMLISSNDDRKKGTNEAIVIPAFRYSGGSGEQFVVTRRKLESALVAEKNPAKKQKLLMDLARHYVEHGFGPEAMGLLRVMKSDNPSVEATADFRALRGVAAALSGNNDQAKQDLTSEDLQYQPIAKLWLGYALARDNNWQAARASFAESGNSETALPAILQPRIILAKAEAALQANDITSAETELKKIKDTDKLTASERADYDYIHASTLIIAGKKEPGLETYGRLINGTDQLYRTKAELQYIDQKVAAKQMKLDEAIERLERLRYVWRGDRIEIDVLRRLGKYYIDSKDYLQGLTMWRQAASLSKNTDDTDAITQDMQSTFNKLYVDGEADKIEPLRALAIFDSFRELTPSGDAGYTAQKRLADRLIAVDLLDQADALLENLMHKQATGQEAAMIGAKLANVRILDRNATGALKALSESDQPTIDDPKLQKRRMLLKARALADQGQSNEALALLNDDQFPEGLSLKADVLWRQNRWPEAVVALQKLAVDYRDQGQNDVKGPLPDLVLKMAIAMSLDDNKKGLGLLVSEYGDYMGKTPRAEAFNLITKPSRGSSLADLETLKSQVGEVELFEKFLKKFES